MFLVDNAPDHIEPDEILSKHKLPPITTAMIQPMDQGIIAAVKKGVRRTRYEIAVDRLIEGDDSPYSVNLVEAIEWLSTEWQNLSEETIRNCWRHSGLLVDRLNVHDVLNPRNTRTRSCKFPQKVYVGSSNIRLT